jgi:hypothetical protein
MLAYEKGSAVFADFNQPSQPEPPGDDPPQDENYQGPTEYPAIADGEPDHTPNGPIPEQGVTSLN